MSPDEFLVAMGASIVQHTGLDRRVHVKSRFDGQVGSMHRCLVEIIRKSFNGHRHWPLHVQGCRKKSSRSLSHLLMSSCTVCSYWY